MHRKLKWKTPADVREKMLATLPVPNRREVDSMLESILKEAPAHAKLVKEEEEYEEDQLNMEAEEMAEEADHMVAKLDAKLESSTNHLGEVCQALL